LPLRASCSFAAAIAPRLHCLLFVLSFALALTLALTLELARVV
jgi:hypothetical protein